MQPQPPVPDLRYRQVHLDFHTSPHIQGIADDFDPEDFARTLNEARINSITCFAVCHHGLSYYPTRVGTVHPNLKRDLLGEQIEACHRRGIRTPGYLPVVWSEEQANQHPEWRQIGKDGYPVGRRPVGPINLHDWQWLCMNSPFADHLAASVDEVVRGYPIDGLFLDIIMSVQPGCVCAYCLKGMLAAGLNPDDDDDLRRYTLSVERSFMERISRLVWSLRPDLPLFFNARLRLNGDPALGNRPERDYYSHWEIESLASGGWGYNHFPLYDRYFQSLGKPRLGMTAAFHRSWADFGTVKSQAALDYECFRMLASGAACSIGDQLHPRGRLNAETYRRIGRTYAAVEAREPWCQDARPLAEIGVLLTPQADSGTKMAGLVSEQGAMHMLLELGAQFQMIDRDADLSPYRVIIAPDSVRLDTVLLTRLRAFLAMGGALLLTHESGLSTDGQGFALGAEMGIEYRGPSRYDVEFLRPVDGLEREIPPMDHALYERGSAVLALPGTQRLGVVVPPYFSRTWEHFNSHAQTPPDLASEPELAAVTLRERVGYASHPLFSTYHRHGYPVYRQVVAALLHRLLPQPLLRTTLPTTAEVTVLRQVTSDGGARMERVICHILHYVPQRRTPDLDLVEDLIPLENVTIAVRTEWQPSAAYLAPQRSPVAVRMDGQYARVVVPRVEGHAMLVLER